MSFRVTGIGGSFQVEIRSLQRQIPKKNISYVTLKWLPIVTNVDSKGGWSS
jgi:hypothetical protein